MKHFQLSLCAALLLTAISCKKSDSSDTITYEVRITKGTWSGAYFDYSGNSQALKSVNNLPDRWKYSFSIAHGKKAGLVLSAIPDNVDGTITATANIYQNGKIISSDNSPYGANAQIIINE